MPLDNPYEAWQKANAALVEVNTIMGVFNQTLEGLEIPSLHRLVIQGYMLQIVQAINEYTKFVQPMLEGED